VRIRHITTHSLQALAEASLIALLIVGLMTGTAFAAKGGGKPAGSSSISLVVLDADGVASHGGLVTFAVTTSDPYPVASVTCSQSGTVVYGASLPMYQPNIWDSDGTFILSSMAWSSGAADCTALLKGTSRGKVVTLASTTFYVSA
jgi:hypothetical protein